ncbi:MAG: hypothetical protein K5871_08040 [Lachnospiraceae bacterium]|nr:hypothetical protein [Lachnospiraceae bacterium]
MKALKKAEFLTVTALLTVYLGIFAYLNLFCFKQHVDSDIAAESLLVREIWQQRTLTPDNWAGSTERYVFGMPAIAAPFYAMTGSMSLATGIADVLLGAFFVVTMYLFFKWIGLRKETVMLSLLMLAALPMNGLENEDQIVPFFAILFYVFADWYVLFFAIGIYSFMFYRYLKEKKEYTKKDIKLVIPAFILFCTATVLSAGGMHTVQISLFPLFLYECVSLLIDSKMLSRKLPKTRFVATGFTVLQMIAFGISTLHHGQVDYVTYVVSKEELVSNLFVDIPALFMKNFGFEGGVRVGNLGSVMHMMLIAFLVLVVMAFVGVFGKNNADSRAKDALGFFICIFGVAAVLMILLTVGKLSYYLFAAWFVAILVIAMYSEKLSDEKKGFADLIVLAVILFAVLNLSYTYKGAIDCKDNLAKYEEVTDYMRSEGLYYGYAEFWDANRLALVTDGELVFGCSYFMEDLEMYWWLTNTDWYPPTMPTEMRTAYVIRKGKEAGFLAQFEDPSIMEEAFANERFTVYVSDYNLVNKP